ncbi:MAG: ABC transporter permease, partial [Chloroflexota bacterium]|nr:ABC transporter permease [Chloroflexota bacterium]
MSMTRPREIEIPQETSTAEIVRSGSAGSKNARNIGLIIKREYMNRVKRRSFVIVTIIMMLLIIAAASFPTILAVISSQSQTSMTVVNNAGTIAGLNGSDLNSYINRSLNVTYDSTGQPQATSSNKKPSFAIKMGQSGDENALRQQVRDGKISILLIIARSATNDLSFTYYTNASLSQNTDLAQVQAMATQLNTLDKLAHLGISPSQQQTLFAPTTFSTVSTLQQNTGRTPAESAIASFVSIIGIVLIYITLQLYGSAVASGVAEEKGSRIMELLINAATPFQLLMGKIIGIGLAGFTQLGLLGLVGAAAFLAQNPIKNALLGGNGSGPSLDFTNISLDILGLVVIYFVLGLFLYATLYA